MGTTQKLRMSLELQKNQERRKNQPPAPQIVKFFVFMVGVIRQPVFKANRVCKISWQPYQSVRLSLLTHQRTVYGCKIHPARINQPLTLHGLMFQSTSLM